MMHKVYRKVLLLRPFSYVIRQIGHPRNIRVAFTLKYIQALLEKEGGYEVRLIDCALNSLSFDELVETSLLFLPDLIVVDCTTLEYHLTLRYARALEERGDFIVVAIGQDPSADPGRYIFLNSPIDMVLAGESELALISLLHELNNGRNFKKIKGFYSLNFQNSGLNIVENPDALPFPPYTPEEFKKYIFFYPLRMNKKAIWGHVLSSRGCPYNCTFCSQTIRKSYGKRLRMRNPRNIVDEIEYLTQKGANVIAFEDDNFTTSKEHVRGVCHELKKRKLNMRWSAHARVDEVTRELLEIMKEAGCIQLRFGIESGSNRIIKILRKTDQDIDWVNKAREVFSELRRVGIPATALFLVGNPTERKEDIKKSMKLAKELNPDILQICFFTPYPGSSAYQEFKDGIKDEDIQEIYHYQSGPMNLSNLSLEDLQRMYKKFYRSFLLNPAYLFKHLVKYGPFYLHNRKTFFELLNIRRRL